MKRFSHVCTGIMLILFLLLLDASLLLGTFGSLPHRSYLLSLLAALPLTAALLWLARRPASLFERWGEGRTGLLLACLCFGLNLLWVLCVRTPIFGDASAFWDTASALAEGAELENASYLALFPHLLGYSSFLSLFLRLFGCRPIVAYLLNVCLCTLSGLLLYRITLRFGTLRQAAWAFLLWALCPSKLLYNGMVLSDGLYTCLLLSVFDLLSALERKGIAWKQLILSGLAAGVLLWAVNASRPLALIAIIALFLWLLFLRGTSRGTGRWLALMALLLLVYVPLGRLWSAHIAQLVGEEPAPIPGYNIYVGFNQETGGTYSVEDMGLLGDYRWAEGGSAVKAQQQMLEAAKDRILSGSIQFPRLIADKLRNLLGNDEGAAYSMGRDFRQHSFRFFAMLSNTCYYALLLLANAGCCRLWQGREQGLVLCLPLFGLGLILAQLLVEVSIRYHYILIPILIVLAALCLSSERQRR